MPGRGPAERSESVDRNTLIYVDQELILPIAARLIGTSLSAGESEEVSGGFRWVVAAAAGYGRESATEVDVAKLFPEDLFHYCYPKIAPVRLSVSAFCDKVGIRDIRPPDVVSVVGVLRIEGVGSARYDPFDPPKIDLPQHQFYGYRTFTAALRSPDGFSVPVHFLANSASIVYYANEKPVELVGVVKWAPSYESAGHTLNAILLCAALLLAR